MNNKDEKITDLKDEAKKYAAKEQPFSGEDLAAEIEPLMREYFLADIEMCGNHIDCTFLNGQKMRVSVEEVT